MDSPALKIEALYKSYGRIMALRGVNLEVKRGQVFGFLGPNGAGKTTTIRCLLDLIRPQSGTIRVLGLDPQANSLAVRAQVGYLPGELNLESNLTAENILHYFNSLRGRKVEWSYVRRLAERLDLNLTTAVKNMSKGNKQKVGVVQALMSRPELLLLDEPTSGLDPLIQQEVYRLLQEARQEGATIFFSSHIISEVETIAEQVAIIRNGVIVEVAEPHHLMKMAIRRARVRFSEAVDSLPLGQLPGIQLLDHDSNSATLQIEGEMGSLIKALAAFPVRDLETERPSLEELFLAYYERAKS